MDDYKNANLTISTNCKKISEMLLVKIDGKRVYDNLEFEDEQVTGFSELTFTFWTLLGISSSSDETNQCFCLQKNHRSLVQTRLQVIHVEIVGIMKQTYEVFKHDGQEVLIFDEE